MSIRNIKLVIHYDGTNYHGWASQPETATVQGTIEEVIEKLTGQPVKVYGSSRTDAGVHALGQVANFRITSAVPSRILRLLTFAKCPTILTRSAIRSKSDTTI
ncbi:MAG: hypothetical protein ACYSOG_01285 [Planctomycetota bacterium]